MNKYDMTSQKNLAELCVYKDDQITELWKLLDDISTAGDMFKPEINPYFKYVNRKCEARSNVANSLDGYNLTIKERWGIK
jgi:hypothetical protein